MSITAFTMVPVTELDPQDVFDAEGLRAITESVQTNREQTNRIQREQENLIIGQNVVARKRQPELEQAQKRADADQPRRVSEYAACQSAETAKVVFEQERGREVAEPEKVRTVETARIAQQQAVSVAQATRQRVEREALIEAEKAQQAAEIARARVIEAASIEKEKAVQAAEIDRQRSIEAAAIDEEKAVEVARIAKQIAVKQGEEAEARAAAAMTLARAEQEKANQAVVTVETTAQAEREKAIQVIQAQADAEVQRALAEGEAAEAQALAEASLARARGDAEILRQQAQAKADAAEKEAQAAILLAGAVAVQGEAQAQARRKMLDAENAVSTRVLFRDVALKALDVAPELTRELMSPARAIREIRVLQTQGVGSSGAVGTEGAGAAFGTLSPIIKTLLEAGAAYPMLRELVRFGQVDTDKIADGARSILEEVGSELAGSLSVERSGDRSEDAPTSESGQAPSRDDSDMETADAA